MVCFHGGGGPQVGEVKYGGSPHLSCKPDQIKMSQVKLPHLSGLPHQPGVPHLHANRPSVVPRENLLGYRQEPKTNSTHWVGGGGGGSWHAGT